MADIQAGAFFLFAGIGFVGLVLSMRWPILPLLSAVVFIFLALAMFSQYNVVMNVDKQVVNSTKAKINSGTQNVTYTFTTITDKVKLINANFMTFGYVFVMLAFFSIFLFARQVFFNQ